MRKVKKERKRLNVEKKYETARVLSAKNDI